MADEEAQRTMRFILGRQARLNVSPGRLAERVDELSEKVDRTADSINSLLVIAELQEREIRALGESVNAVGESVSAVDESGRETGGRLHALVNAVERYISERRNGKS